MGIFVRNWIIWALVFSTVSSAAWASSNKCRRWYLQFGLRTVLAVPVATLLGVWGFQGYMGHLEAEKRKALVAAANAGDSKKMFRLINEGARVYRDDRGFYKVASDDDHFDLVKLLLQKGVDPSAEDYAVLKWAIEGKTLYPNRLELIEQILEASPKPTENSEYAKILELHTGWRDGGSRFSFTENALSSRGYHYGYV